MELNVGQVLLCAIFLRFLDHRGGNINSDDGGGPLRERNDQTPYPAPKVDRVYRLEIRSDGGTDRLDDALNMLFACPKEFLACFFIEIFRPELGPVDHTEISKLLAEEFPVFVGRVRLN